MTPSALKKRLERTWGAFFGQHGNFTAIQLAAIPPLLDGDNVLLHAGTASGKTAAALAPLIERHLPPDRPPGRLRLLYLLPTRALIRDIGGRLAAPLESLRVAWAVKTRDVTTLDARHPADLLLTTPESLDSLLAATPEVLIHVRAVVIDELHAFDAGIRGDHLRVLLRRLQALRVYAAGRGDTDDAQIQYAGLSATLGQPEISAARYFSGARIISAETQRTLLAECLALEDGEPHTFGALLQDFRARMWKKALVFCNTRAEVERYAAYVRARRAPFGEAVYVHYSNLERQRRQEIEDQFAQADAAICFASSTLELGIDIGSIDTVMMIGAPGSMEAFMQRAGRASRRQQTASVICFYRTPLEQVLFECFIAFSAKGQAQPSAFRPSVIIQQIFSLLKASPQGSLRLNPLAELFAGWAAADEVEAILGELQARGYLKAGRMGEWRAGDRLNQLVDLQGTDRAPLSLYSNLQINLETVTIRERDSQRVMAHMDRLMFGQEQLILEGRRLNVEWVDGTALWVSAASEAVSPARAVYRSASPILSAALTRLIPLHLGLATNAAPLVAAGDAWLWFHCAGDVYGQAILDLLRYTLPAQRSALPGLCVHVAEALSAVPAWSQEQVTRYVLDHVRLYERLLAPGAYHHLLPPTIRRRAVLELFDVPRFLALIRTFQIVAVSENAAILTELVSAAQQDH